MKNRSLQPMHQELELTVPAMDQRNAASSNLMQFFYTIGLPVVGITFAAEWCIQWDCKGPGRNDQRSLEQIRVWLSRLTYPEPLAHIALCFYSDAYPGEILPGDLQEITYAELEKALNGDDTARELLTAGPKALRRLKQLQPPTQTQEEKR